jgi:hypothetical protein
MQQHLACAEKKQSSHAAADEAGNGCLHVHVVHLWCTKHDVVATATFDSSI